MNKENIGEKICLVTMTCMAIMAGLCALVILPIVLGLVLILILPVTATMVVWTFGKWLQGSKVRVIREGRTFKVVVDDDCLIDID